MIAVVVRPWRKDRLRIEPERLEKGAAVADFGRRNASHQMGPHIMGFRWRGVIHISADIQVVVIGLRGDFFQGDGPGIIGHVS